MNHPAIHIERLSRDFGAVHAVDHLSLHVPAGIVFGFLGPNGSGKTTTIRLLLGILAPTSGTAGVLGFDVRTHADQIRERCGVLLEHHGLYERMSAEDNLELYGRIWHLPPGERQTRSKDLLMRVGLWERRAEPVGTWSRGMKQKLAVARAMLHRPALIFLDEPTAGLDPLAAAALRDDLALAAAQEGTTIFLTTHNLTEAESLCAVVGVIRSGKLLAVGSPDTLRRHAGGARIAIAGRGFDDQTIDHLRSQPHVAMAELKDGQLHIALDGEADAAPLVHLLVHDGARIEEVRRGQPTLEAAFRTLMEEPS